MLWLNTDVKNDVRIAYMLHKTLGEVRPDLFPDFMTDTERWLWIFFVEEKNAELKK